MMYAAPHNLHAEPKGSIVLFPLHIALTWKFSSQINTHSEALSPTALWPGTEAPGCSLERPKYSEVESLRLFFPVSMSDISTDAAENHISRFSIYVCWRSYRACVHACRGVRTRGG